MASGLNIAVVGAGPGGLTLARALQHAGCNTVTVFERHDRMPCTRGGTIRIDLDAQKAMETLLVLESAKAIGLLNARFDSRSNGRFLFSSPVRELSISREALQKVLADSLRSGTVNLCKKVVAAEESSNSVMLSFSDGTRKSFDLVVGADGCQSAISALLFPNDPGLEFTGFVVYYCIAKGAFVGDEPLHSEFLTSVSGIGYRIVTAGGGGTDGRWDSLQVTTRGPECSNQWDAESTKDVMRLFLDLAQECLPPGARHILENAEVVQKWGMFQSQDRPTWISPLGHATLLGDAVHAMAPFTGQGASSAIVDASVLGHLLGTYPMAEALRHYERSRKTECERKIRGAKWRGRMITAHGLSRWFLDMVTPKLLPYLLERVTGDERLARSLAYFAFMLLKVAHESTELADSAIGFFRPPLSML